MFQSPNFLILSWWETLLYRSQSTDLQGQLIYMIGTSIMKKLKASEMEFSKKSSQNFSPKKIDISYPQICTSTCAYQEVRNASFLENSVDVLNR